MNQFEKKSVRKELAALKAQNLPLLSYICTDKLPKINPSEVLQDELIERTLQISGISMIFGESNSGKTFMAVHMGMCVATGEKFLGRNVKQAAVLYIAAESPSGVEMRARAWQEKHDIRSEKFFICPNQVNLYEESIDQNAIIELARHIEVTHKVKIGLIIFDTLARISAGANENSNDMGKVMSRCDVISSAISAHVSVIHHSGKDSLKGARGWSGLRAHIDTEIEVSQANGVSVALISKQREIEGKGDRLAFKLGAITIGVNQWGNARTTCWIQETEVPAEINRQSKSHQDVINAVNSFPTKSATRKEIAEYLKKDISNTNKIIRGMIDEGVLSELMNKIFIKQDFESDTPF